MRAAAPPSPQGLPLGSPAPDFELPDLAGARQRLADFRGRQLLLLFFNPRCGFCTRIAPALAALAVDGAGGAPLPLVITTGDAEKNRKLVAEHGIRCPVLLQEAGTHGVGSEIGAEYRCNGTPMGYLIDAQGHIASELAIGGPALLALAEAGDRRVPTKWVVATAGTPPRRWAGSARWKRARSSGTVSRPVRPLPTSACRCFMAASSPSPSTRGGRCS